VKQFTHSLFVECQQGATLSQTKSNM